MNPEQVSEKYGSTRDFIHVCYGNRKQRIKDLASKIGFKERSS